jgi:UDP-glucose 4-epimerase
VTGGAGFIGSHIVEALVKKGHAVRVIDNLSVSDTNVSLLKSLDAELYVADIGDFDQIKDLFSGVDTVFHLAAMNRAQRSIEKPLEANSVNVTGTINVLEASKRYGVKRFINISSSSVYSGVRESLLSEDMPLSPSHPYGVGKLAGEHYVRIYYELYGLPTLTLRYFSVYGPRQLGNIEKAGVIARFIHLAYQGRPLEIYGTGEQRRNFTYVSDVVEVTIRSAEADVVGKIINVANEREVSVNHLADVVKRVVRDVGVRYLPIQKADPERNPADIRYAKKFLNFSPKVSLEDGVERTAEWYERYG